MYLQLVMSFRYMVRHEGSGRARPPRRTGKARDPMISLAFTFGPRITLRSAQLRRALMSRDYLIFFALSCLVVALLNPLEATRQQSLPVQAVIWLGAGGLFHLSLLGCTWILAQAGPLARFGYAPLGYAIALLVSESFNYWFHFVVLGVTTGGYPGIGLRVVQQLPIIVTMEQVFVRFLAPLLLDSPALRPLLPGAAGFAPPVSGAAPQGPQAAPAVPAPAPAPRRLRVDIGGQLFDPQEIRLLGAQEHYTRVVAAGGAHLLRVKISDAAGNLPADLGMRVHRSWWIAYAHAREVVKDAPGRYAILTAGGERIPLSRDLRKAFEARLASMSHAPAVGGAPEAAEV